MFQLSFCMKLLDANCVNMWVCLRLKLCDVVLFLSDSGGSAWATKGKSLFWPVIRTLLCAFLLTFLLNVFQPPICLLHKSCSTKLQQWFRDSIKNEIILPSAYKYLHLYILSTLSTNLPPTKPGPNCVSSFTYYNAAYEILINWSFKWNIELIFRQQQNITQ